MIPHHILRELTLPYEVTDNEFSVLALAIAGLSTKAIAERLRIKPEAVRKRLGEIYKKFQIEGEGPGKLASLQQVLMADYYAADLSRNPSSLTNPTATSPGSKETKWDWGDAIDITFFGGRKQELTELKQWIITDRSHLVALLGMGGIGKTSLAIRFANDAKAQFDYLIWRSLLNAPTLDQWLTDVLTVLGDRTREDSIASTTEGKLSQLTDYLRQYRCLLILDNFETVLKSGERVGVYQAEHEGYGTLLKRIGETAHQSCLIITSREKPREIALLEGNYQLPVRSLQLTGLAPLDAEEILKLKGLSGSSEQWQELVKKYSGNPLALKIISTAIQDLFAGDVGEFLRQETVVFGEIRDLLDQQFNRLFELEQEIMYWLAINYEPVFLSELRKDFLSSVSLPKLLDALESLKRRGIIEQGVPVSPLFASSSSPKYGTSFTLQPVVMEYLIERLVEQMAEEITTQSIHLFNQFSLIKAQAKDYIRNIQIRAILRPVLEQIISKTGSSSDALACLNHLLSFLHQAPFKKPGYAAGNLLNLLVHLQVDLTGYDFSELTVWQAYLQDVRLHRVNFRKADLAKSVFAEPLASILTIAFSPGGEWLATGDANGKIRLQVVDGEQLFSCEGHGGWVRSVAFSPDGQTLASGSDDQTVKLWDTRTGKCSRTLTGHTNFVRAVCFSPDGRLLASASDDWTMRVWDVETGRCCHTLVGHEGRVRAVVFLPGGQQIVSGSSDRTLRLWDVGTGTCLATWQGHTDRILSISVSADGRLLASGSADRTIRIWQGQAGHCLHCLQGHNRGVLSVHFSPTGYTLASGSDDQTVKVWDALRGECLKSLTEHRDRVWSVAFSPKDPMLATGGDDQTVRLWDTVSYECLRTLQGYNQGVRSVAFNPDGQRVASGGEDRRVWLWDVKTGRVLHTFQEHTRRVWCVRFSPDGRLLASGSDDQTVKLWDLVTGQCQTTLQSGKEWIRAIAFSPDGAWLASSGDDRLIQIWNVVQQEHLHRLQGHTSWIWCLSFNPKGSLLASGSTDRTVRLWDTQGWETYRVLEGHTDAVTSVAFSPDGQWLASSSIDRTVRVWEMTAGQCIQVLPQQHNWVRSLTFVPSLEGTNAPLLVTGSGDRTVKLWDICSGTCVKVLAEHKSRVRSVEVSPDGRLLASGGNDATIQVWKVHTGECIQTLKLPILYEGMDITEARGLTEFYRRTLLELGAIEQE